MNDVYVVGSTLSKVATMAKSHLVGTVGASVVALSSKVEAIKASLKEEQASIIKAHEKRFTALGGCYSCSGRGFYPGNDDYAPHPCGACNGIAWANVEERPLDWNGRFYEGYEIPSRLQSESFLSTKKALGLALVELAKAKEDNKPKVGCRVRVTQGRGKCKAGIEGTVEFIKDGYLCLIVSLDGSKVWCDKGYLSVVIEHNEERVDREVWRQAKAEEREKENAAMIAKASSLPALVGSEKQVSWAISIRAKMLHNVLLTDEQRKKVEKAVMARDWIDNREFDFLAVIGETSKETDAKLWLKDQASYQTSNRYSKRY